MQHLRHVLVVSYSISTSNHNAQSSNTLLLSVVSYSISTSNHNSCDNALNASGVVSYSISTSNHNRFTWCCVAWYVVSYSISTSNHNAGYLIRLFPESYIVFTINKMGSKLPAKCVWCYFLSLTYANILKNFQLLRRCELCSLNFPPKVLYFAILLICDTQNTCQSRRRHWVSNPCYVYIHILLRWAMADIDRVLHHRKTIFLQCLTKLGCRLALLFSCGWQVKEYKEPHNMISI